MNNTLKINFEKLRTDISKEFFDSLERGFSKFNIDFYIIGAFARDLWTDHIPLPDKRTTRDIDFCVYINDHREYQDLINHLVAQEKFVRDNEPYRLISKEQNIIDLIPFGGIEKNDEVYLEGNPPRELSVYGNRFILAHAEKITIDNADFKICTLPGLCIMKLISGFENADRKLKDHGDFYFIVENYFEISGDTLYEIPHYDLIDENFEPAHAAARLLGRQMCLILKESEKLSQKIESILVSQQDLFSDEDINQMYAMADKDDKKVLRYKLIQFVLLGIHDQL